MSRFFLVRHAQAEQGSRLYLGHGATGLDHEGYAQARALRDLLASQQIHAVYSSDLNRARLTAQIIASVHAAEVVLRPELREIDWGQIEGLTFEEITARFPEALEVLTVPSLASRAPGGESLQQLVQRVQRFLAAVERDSPDQTILIVSHGGPLRVLLCHWLGLDPERLWQIRLDLASMSLVETYPQGAIVAFLNDTSHLRTVDWEA